MIGTINIKVQAGHPSIPIPAVSVIRGSAMSLTILDVPRAFGDRAVTGVNVTITNADNTIRGYSAKRVGSAWGVTIPATVFATGGEIDNGIRITAIGTDENGNYSAWKIGSGELRVIDDDSTVTIDGTQYYAHIVDDESGSNPQKGDLSIATLRVFNGSDWVSLSRDVETAVANDVKRVWNSTKNQFIDGAGNVFAEAITCTGGAWVLSNGVVIPYEAHFDQSDYNTEYYLFTSDTGDSDAIHYDVEVYPTHIDILEYGGDGYIAEERSTAHFVDYRTGNASVPDVTCSNGLTAHYVAPTTASVTVNGKGFSKSANVVIKPVLDDLPSPESIDTMTLSEQTAVLKKIVKIIKG